MNSLIWKLSYVVAYRIAQEKKPFTIGESLLEPAMEDAVKITLGDAAASKITPIPLSAEMAHDVQ